MDNKLCCGPRGCHTPRSYFERLTGASRDRRMAGGGLAGACWAAHKTFLDACREPFGSVSEPLRNICSDAFRMPFGHSLDPFGRNSTRRVRALRARRTLVGCRFGSSQHDLREWAHLIWDNIGRLWSDVRPLGIPSVVHKNYSPAAEPTGCCARPSVQLFVQISIDQPRPSEFVRAIDRQHFVISHDLSLAR